MQITIAERLRPFSHTPGATLLLPTTLFELHIFPAAIAIYDLSETSPQRKELITLAIHGPVEQFTVMQDLERGEIRVWGEGAEGYFRYTLFPLEKLIGAAVEKSPVNGPLFSSSSILKVVQKHEKPLSPSLTRISLGNHKAQDWELVSRRCDMQEIFPIWLHLGQYTADVENINHPLLVKCHEAIDSGRPETIVPAFKTLFKVGFKGILSPTFIDERYQGIALPEIKTGSPLILLKRGAELILSLFIDQLKILPTVPPEFHCGRLLNASCANIGFVDLEWTKKSLRRMVLHSTASGDATFKFPGGIKRFRFRQKEADRGVILTAGTPLALEPSENYYLDNFQE